VISVEETFKESRGEAIISSITGADAGVFFFLLNFLLTMVVVANEGMAELAEFILGFFVEYNISEYFIFGSNL
jgi:hypothetical protein